jgi:hypothetical protein
VIEKIDILGVTYAISLVPAISREKYTIGQCDYANQSIDLDMAPPPDLMGATLFHEVLHAVLEGVGEDCVNSDEGSVQRIARGLYQALKPYVDFSGKEKRLTAKR